MRRLEIKSVGKDRPLELSSDPSSESKEPLSEISAANKKRKISSASGELVKKARKQQETIEKFKNHLRAKRNKGDDNFSSSPLKYKDIPEETRTHLMKVYFGGFTPLIKTIISLSSQGRKIHGVFELPSELKEMEPALKEYYEFCCICSNHRKKVSSLTLLKYQYSEDIVSYESNQICRIPKEIAHELNIFDFIKSLEGQWFLFKVRGSSIELRFKKFEVMNTFVKDIIDLPPLIVTEEEKARQEKYLEVQFARLRHESLVRHLGIFNRHLLTIEQLIQEVEEMKDFAIPIRVDDPEFQIFIKRLAGNDLDEFIWNEKWANRILNLLIDVAESDIPLMVEKCLRKIIQDIGVFSFTELLKNSNFFREFREKHITFLNLFIENDVIDKTVFNIMEGTSCPVFYLAKAKQWDVLKVLVENSMVEWTSLNFACESGETALSLIIKDNSQDLLSAIGKEFPEKRHTMFAPKCPLFINLPIPLPSPTEPSLAPLTPAPTIFRGTIPYPIDLLPDADLNEEFLTEIGIFRESFSSVRSASTSSSSSSNPVASITKGKFTPY